MTRPLAAIALFVTFTSAQAAFSPVEDFGSYTIGNLGAGAASSDAFVPNGGPWAGYDGSTTIPGSSYIGISEVGGNRSL